MKDFIRSKTQLVAPLLVPEIRLHLADEPFGLWKTTERELGQAGLPFPFWAFAWVGGQTLARYILDHPELVRSRHVLDLASGSGLVAIAAAMAGAAAVTASDVDPIAAAAIDLNAEANGVAVTATREDPLDGDGQGHEIVLAGDVFYEQPMAGRVLPFLERAWARGAGVLVGDPGRAYLPLSRFQVLATYDVPVIPAIEDADVKRTMVLQPAWD
jgi:predicted nicotinamide N-methyase